MTDYTLYYNYKDFKIDVKVQSPVITAGDPIFSNFNPFSNDKTSNQSKLKAFADDKITVI